MIGGQAPQAVNEHLYEVTFPERPGALADFLKAVGTNWNISLFHYRSAASDSGRVLIGFEAENNEALEVKLRAAGFEFSRADTNTSINLFIR